MKKKKILVLCPYPKGEAAGQRLKYEQYFNDWEKEGYEITISSFSDINLWRSLYSPKNNFIKILGTLRGYIIRIRDLFYLKKYDLIYIFMWVTPFGTTLFERLVRFLSKKVIYDFDDAVHLTNHVQNHSLVRRVIGLFRGKNKTNYLIKSSDHVIVSSPFHVDFCKEKNRKSNCTYIPCSLDGSRFVPSKTKHQNDIPVIGWTGTFSSKFYLDSLMKVFLELKKRCDFKLLIIGNFDFTLPNINLEVIKWTKKNEVQDLQLIDIGIYPLLPDEWGLGKGALKAIHYMAIGIPLVATDFGTTSLVVKDKVNGFLVKSEKEWVEALENLIKDIKKRKEFGEKGREIFEFNYSTNVVKNKYLSVLNSL